MSVTIRTGDCRTILAGLPDDSVQCVVTSPPYFGLRDYGVADQIGLEPTPAAYVEELVEVFRQVRRVLHPTGTLWLNLGDSYAGSGRGGYVGGASTLDGTTAGQAQARAAAGKHAAVVGAGSIGRRWVPPASGWKAKDLIGIPWRVAFALQADGWWLRQDIIWHKPNPMPESVTDRCTKAHEYLFLLTKSERYFYDAQAIAEPGCGRDPGNQRPHKHDDGSGWNRTKTGLTKVRRRGVPPYHERYESSDQSGLDLVGRGQGRNARSVWTIATAPFPDAHFAIFPPSLAERCILAGSRPGDTVLDPFAGAGTTGLVADRLQRNAELIELNPAYAEMARRRIAVDAGPLLAGAA